MIDNLLKYQEADAKLREIEKELAKSEERKKAVEAKKFLDGVEAMWVTNDSEIHYSDGFKNYIKK